MRPLRQILGEMQSVQRQMTNLQWELKNLQDACQHPNVTKHAGMCAGMVGRWAVCNDCGKQYGLSSEPGDLDEDEEFEKEWEAL